MTDVLTDFRDAYAYDTNNWADIRKEAKIDMQYVAGNPWTRADEDQRKNRPTVAPEEMGQYFNQVINSLWSNPRGMKFSPTGNGASEKGADVYQNKAREIEYRSHAKIAYVGAAENAIQRSYGFVEVTTKYASPHSANQDIWIEGFPNPDMVLPDTDALRPDSSDMKHCIVHQWELQTAFKRDYPKAKITDFANFKAENQSFIQGNKILLSKFWRITTKKRQLLLVQPPASQMAPPQRQLVPVQVKQPAPVQVFEDELSKVPGGRVLGTLREVDYPEVMWHLTNGLEILDEGPWLGKYIPIVSCYGKTIFVEGDVGMERKILSMTRFGREPWKSYCYACSQQLEIIGMIPKSPFLVGRGQLNEEEQRAMQESMHVPKAYLTYGMTTEATGQQQVLPPPMYPEYPAGQHLQALEMVKEGFRRAIQSAMGSNFLPTQAQRRNEKSGKALDKMEQSAAQGTYHFINSYEDMIRQVGVVCEDLMDKIHDYQGDLDVIEADGKSSRVAINNPQNPEAVSLKGDYLVTVSTAPSSDSQQEAADDFTESLVGELQMITQIAGPKAAAAILARSIKIRLRSPQGDQLADLIEPPEQMGQDGKPIPPEMQALQAQMQQKDQQLQQAGEMIKTEQIKHEAQFKVESMKMDKQAQLQITLKTMDNAAKIEAARIGAAKQSADAAAEANEERIALQLDSMNQQQDRQHELGLSMADAQHEAAMAQLQHDHALEQGQQGVLGDAALSGQGHAQALEQGAQAAALAPEPAQGAPA